jgi:NADH-quinone oxidoreductase subunit J
MWDFCLTWVLLLSSRAIGVVSNPVHSVLFLVLTFFIAALSLLSMGREFLSLLFRVVYMGAIAVLFLFVVMMLDLKEKESNDPLTGSM